MSRERFKARDKVTNKMSKDGLIERNLATGEDKRISNREGEFDIRSGSQFDIVRQESMTKSPTLSNPRFVGNSEVNIPENEPQRSITKSQSKLEQKTKIDQRYTDIQQPHIRDDSPQKSVPLSPYQAEIITTSQHEINPSTTVQNSLHHHQHTQIDNQRTLLNNNCYKTPESLTSANDDKTTAHDTRCKHEMSKISQNEQQNIQSTIAAVQSETAEESEKEQSSDTEKVVSFENPREPPVKTKGKFRTNRLNTLLHDGQKYEPSAVKHEKISKCKRQSAEFKGDNGKSGDHVDDLSMHSEQCFQPSESKLQFTEDEKTPQINPEKAPEKTHEKAPKKPKNRKLAKAEHQVERIGAKLEKAKDKLPAKKKLVYKRVFDEKAGKVKHKLNFEKTVKTQKQHLQGSLPLRPIKLGTNSMLAFGHRKLFQVEHENVGTKAAHRAELLVEGGVRTALHFHKTAPYGKVAKLERKGAKKAVKLTYQRTLAENPKLKSNLFSRMWQKRKIRKDYAKAFRETQKAAKRTKKIGAATSKTFKAIADVVRRHPAAAGITVIVILLLFFMVSFMSSLSNIFNGGLASIVATSYLSSDTDLDNAELSYTEWETDLKLEIDKAEQDYPNYDEYIYNISDIRHNPYELISFLTAVYQDYNYADIESVLQQMFDEQYQLTFTPTTETRYRTNSDGSRTAYTWKTLTITLTTRSFTDIAYSRMSNEQREIYDLLMQSKGNRQYVDSPFEFNWLTSVTSYYGYRVHPTSETKNYHKGVDIAVPIGTDIHAGFDGRVTSVSYDSGGYGHYVVIENDKGVVAKYAHCHSILVSVGQTVKRGDIIAKSGNSGISTGPHLHLEVLKDGQYLNPLIFAVTNAEFGTEPEYGDPGSPLGDGSYAALNAVGFASSFSNLGTWVVHPLS